MYHYIVVLLIVASLFIFLPLSIGIYRYKYLQIDGKILFVYLILSLLIDEIYDWYTSIQSIQNHYIINTFIPIEFLLLSSIFWLSFKTDNYKKILIFTVTGVMIFTIGYHLSNLEKFNRFSSFTNAIMYLSLMFIVIMYFYELLKELHVVKLSLHPMFWISVGVILYVSINFFLFIFGEFVMFNSSKEISKLWAIINCTSTIIFRIFLTIGLWFSKTPIQSNLSSK
jgi:hypothetical protein